MTYMDTAAYIMDFLFSNLLNLISLFQNNLLLTTKKELAKLFKRLFGGFRTLKAK